MAGIARVLIRLYKNVYYGGQYRISGTVDKLGVVGSYKVLLFARATGVLVQTTWSTSDGNYVFNNLAYFFQGYMVVVLDYNASPENAVIADLVTPELITYR